VSGAPAVAWHPPAKCVCTLPPYPPSPLPPSPTSTSTSTSTATTTTNVRVRGPPSHFRYALPVSIMGGDSRHHFFHHSKNVGAYSDQSPVRCVWPRLSTKGCASASGSSPVPPHSGSSAPGLPLPPSPPSPQFWDTVFGTSEAWDKHVAEFPTFADAKAAVSTSK
jgi:hypothetical protein